MAVKQAFIIHGAYGNPNENWFPWLKEKLEQEDWNVTVPQFPTPENQTLGNWMEAWKGNELDENSILIGHSIGAAFALRLLENHTGDPIKAAFLIAGFMSQLNNPQFDDLNASFLEQPFDWDRIKQNCQRFVVCHSNNDPYVPLAKGEELAAKLDIEITLVENAGHFNKAAGYDTFPQLYNNLTKK